MIPQRPFFLKATALFMEGCICLLLVLTSTVNAVENSSVSETNLDSHNTQVFNWTYGQSAEKSYIFSNLHWWESLDHQMTSIVTLLTLGKNSSSIPVIPILPYSNIREKTNKSLLGTFFDIKEIQKIQPVLTFADFLKTDDYKLLRYAKTGTVPLPKNSQEEFESNLGLFGKLRDSAIALPLPPIDPEHTNQPCNKFPGTIHVSSDGKKRFIFLDRVHFLHFCTEKYMPWWYDIRHRIAPRKPYYDIAEKFLSKQKGPVSSIHINDVMESQKDRDNEEIERYARQIVDSLRNNQALSGTMYLIYSKTGKNVQKVVDLLKQEFTNIVDCSAMYVCLERVSVKTFTPSLSNNEVSEMFQDSTIGRQMVEWALSTRSDIFIGNIHSPYSRNICLYRKTHGKPYSVLKGFGELRKIWRWHLRR